jgi:hypothetical protein
VEKKETGTEKRLAKQPVMMQEKKGTMNKLRL